MTDLLDRPVEQNRQRGRRTGGPTSIKRSVALMSLVLGGVIGWAVFANLGPSRAELEQAHWEQVVDYYSNQYQVMADTRARTEAAHWQEVINHYARQYELIANATRQPAAPNGPAHWEAVVDYYEQQWELRSK